MYFKKWISDLLLESNLIKDHNDIQYISFVPVPPYDNFDCAIRCKRIPYNSGELLDNFHSPFVERICLFGNYYNVLFNIGGMEKLLVDIASDEDYGYFNAFVGQYVTVEHTSMTPVYPINLATYRSSVLGSAIAAALGLLGANVKTHYFVEDTARQLYLLSQGTLNCMLNWQCDGKIDHTIGRIFTISYLLTKGLKPDDKVIDRMFPLANKNVNIDSLKEKDVSQEYFSELSRLCLKGHEKTLNDSFANIDCFDFERELLGNVDFSIFTNALEIKQLFETDTLPYHVKNAIYYANLKLHSDIVFSIVSSRQREVIKKSLKELSNPLGIKVIHFGDVVVLHDGKRVIDSIRQGFFSSVDQYFINLSSMCAASQSQVCAAIRYQMLSCRSEDTCVLDENSQAAIGLIINYEKLIRQLNEHSCNASQTEDTPILHSIVKEICRFEEIVRSFATNFSYPKLITYVENLAKLLCESIENSSISSAIAVSSKRVLENAFRLMGMNTFI